MFRTAESSRQLQAERITAIQDAAAGDDLTLLRLCGEELAVVREYVERIEHLRDAAAQRAREAGEPMSKLARLAQVSDSYLSRRLIRAGSPRRLIRSRRDTGGQDRPIIET